MSNIITMIESHVSPDFIWKDKFQYMFILDGIMHLQINSENYIMKKGDFIFIRPYEFFCCLNSEDSYKCYIVEIPTEIIEEACPDYRDFNFSRRLIRSGNEDSTYNEICANLASIVMCYQRERPSDNLLKYRCVLSIAEILVHDFLVNSESDEELLSEKNSKHYETILKYIESHYSDNITLNDIAKVCSFHPQYFSVYFKRTFKTNFTDYINSYRVNKSLSLLRNSKENILDIALAVGFNNHKTYSSAFKKIYGMTPGQFKQQIKITAPDNGKSKEAAEYSDFDELLAYRKKDDAYSDISHLPRKTKNILFEYGDSVKIKNTMLNGITAGRAISILRQDVQKQLSKTVKDMPLDFIRIRDIFSDDMFVYYEDESKKPSYSWKFIDEIIDYLLSLDVFPFIEIGYMPNQMASKKQYAGWQYHPNISYPKSLDKWMMLVSRFIEHLNIRYGKQNVHRWMFDFWTSPNLNLSDGYWRESKEMFFVFYEATYRAIKKTDPEILFGTPNFSYPSGMSWYKDFLDFSHKKKIVPAFLAVHMYSCHDGLGNDQKDFLKYNTYGENQEIQMFRPGMEIISESLKNMQELIEGSPFPDLKIVIDDWSLSFNPTDYVRDTCFMAPYICKTYFEICPNLLGASFTSLSDINEDYFGSDKMYPGGPGLFDYHGIPKAAFFGVDFSYSFNRNIVQAGDSYVIGKTPEGFEILLFNTGTGDSDSVLDEYALPSYNNRYTTFTKSGSIDFHIAALLKPGNYSVTIKRLSRNFGSSYDTWLKMGAPKRPGQELVEYLEQTCRPTISYRQEKTQNYIYFDEVVEPFGVTYISLKAM